MIEQINIRIKYIVFLIFVIFLVIAGLGTDNSGITGLGIRSLENGNEWIIEFTTKDSADLIIETESGYSSIDDIEFVELRCGDLAVVPNILTNKIVYADYSCGRESYLKFIVNSEGRFRQRLSYGNSSRSVLFKR